MPHIQILNIHGPHTQVVHTLPCQSQQDAPSLRALHWPHENLFSLFLPMFYNDFLLTSLTQLCKVSSPCLSTFVESLLCAWQCARSWLGAGRHNGEQNIVILHSGPTSSAPTFCPNFLSGFQILLESSDLSPFSLSFSQIAQWTVNTSYWFVTHVRWSLPAPPWDRGKRGHCPRPCISENPIWPTGQVLPREVRNLHSTGPSFLTPLELTSPNSQNPKFRCRTLDYQSSGILTSRSE